MEDRALTLDDTQGMFLLLGAGFLAGAASLFSEFVGGCFKCCKKTKKSKSSDSIASNPRWHDELTPREKLNSLQDASNVQNFLVNLRDESTISSLRCEVHENNEPPQEEQEHDYEKEIDELFDIEHLFGEVNVVETSEEQIGDQNNKVV